MSRIADRSPMPAMFMIWPEGRDAMIAVDARCEAEGLSPALLELVRLWCSVLNQCRFCIAMHGDKALAAGLSPALVDDIAAGNAPAGLNAEERAVLALATALTQLDDPASLQDARKAMAPHYDARQTAVLSYAIAQINAWNRLALVSDTGDQVDSLTVLS